MNDVMLVGPDGRPFKPTGIILRPVDGPISDAQVIAQVAAVMVAKGLPAQTAVDNAIEILARAALMVRLGAVTTVIEEIAKASGLIKEPPPPPAGEGN